MAKSPAPDAEGAARVTVFSEGSALPDDVQVIQVTVNRAVNRVPTARLELADGDLAGTRFPVSDSKSFQPGATIRINAGYGDGEQTLFEGIVTRHAVQITGQNDARLVVECCDRVIRMTVDRKNAVHATLRDSDVISSLMGHAGLAGDVECTPALHGELVQYDCTDWDFMLARAQANGLMVIATDGKVAVKRPAVDAEPTLRVTHGVDLQEFHAELDARFPYTVAQAQQPWSGLARISGRMRFQGSAKAVAGGMLELDGVGRRFSGKVFASSVTHTLVDGDWSTEVQFGLPPQGFTEPQPFVAPEAAGLLPAVEGLHVGVVVQSDGDPLGEQRLQVQMPMMPTQTAGVWARLMQFQASDGFGAMFLPEVGDEVVLGYFNNDPSHPVILGSLYSSRRPPPTALAAPNRAKAIVTRCKSRIEFDEDLRTITVTTPGHNRLVISDDGKSILLQDQNDNQVELNPGGIALNSSKDITLTAQGSIRLNAVNAISVSAQADLTCAGLNINCDAQVGFTAKGKASAELSAAGQTVVKGALVMIN